MLEGIRGPIIPHLRQLRLPPSTTVKHTITDHHYQRQPSYSPTPSPVPLLPSLLLNITTSGLQCYISKLEWLTTHSKCSIKCINNKTDKMLVGYFR